MTEKNQKRSLKELREEQGLTYEQLAEKAGVNKFVIRRIEQKRFKRVMVADVLRLSNVLGCMFDMSTSNENDEVKWIPETKIDPKKENGKSLINLRKEYGITIKQLADSTNLEESIIKKIERHDFTGVAPYEFAAIVQCLGRFFVEVFMQNPHETQPQ